MSIYPTKAEILSLDALQPSPEQIAILKEWKDAYPRGTVDMPALSVLVFRLAVAGTMTGPVYCYSPISRTVYLADPPSIISTLHEIGHALYGASELKACQFSVNLFRAVYPRAYAKLHWHGHMLRKQAA